MHDEKKLLNNYLKIINIKIVIKSNYYVINKRITDL